MISEVRPKVALEADVSARLASLREGYMSRLRLLASLTDPDFDALVREDDGFRRHLLSVEEAVRDLEAVVQTIDKLERDWLKARPEI